MPPIRTKSKTSRSKRKPVAEVSKPQQMQKAYGQLKEAIDNGFDFYELFYDRYYSNGQWWLPVGAAPGLGGTSNKVQGYDAYVFRTEQELRLQRDTARLLYQREPIARAIVGHLLAFILGNGFTYRIQPKKNLVNSVSEALIQQAQDVLDDFCEREYWAEREYELLESKLIDGEWFLRIAERNGEIVVRRLEPEHITNPPNGTFANGWFLGVKCDLTDIETVEGYYYHAYPHNDGDILTVKDVIHDKANVTKNVTRGVSSFFCMADDLDGTARLIDGIRAGAQARSKVAYIRSHKSMTDAAAQGFADSRADFRRVNPMTGKTQRSANMQPGTVVDAGDNMEVTTMPQGDVEGYVVAVQMMLRAIGNTFSMPEYLISGDASNANYSSTQMAGSPFVRRMEMEQNRLKPRFKLVMQRVLKHAAKMGLIPMTLLPQIEIDVQAPNPVIQDKLVEAQTYDIEARNGVISPQMWASQLARDPEQVQMERDEYNDRNLMAPQQMFPTGLPQQPMGKQVGQEEETPRYKEGYDPNEKRDEDGKWTSGGGAAKKSKDIKKKTKPKELSEKAQRAKAAHVMVDKTIQRYAEEHNEPRFAKAMGGLSFPDSEPVDVVVGDKNSKVRHGIELKTMVINGNFKITMKRSAMERKAEWEKKNKATFHTVVFDDSAVFNAKGEGNHDESKRVIYYRRGYGSFRVGGMHKVKDMAELKRLMDTPDKGLPPAAQRTKK